MRDSKPQEGNTQPQVQLPKCLLVVLADADFILRVRSDAKVRLKLS